MDLGHTKGASEPKFLRVSHRDSVAFFELSKFFFAHFALHRHIKSVRQARATRSLQNILRRVCANRHAKHAFIGLIRDRGELKFKFIIFVFVNLSLKLFVYRDQNLLYSAFFVP